MTTAPARRGLVFALGFSGLTAAMMQTLVLPLLPQLPEFLHVSTATASWVATSTLIVGAVASPIIGRCGDLYGKRKTLLWVMASLVAGSIVCALSTTAALLIAGRALQGLALGVVPLAVGIVRDTMEAPSFPRATSRISATIGVGSGIGVPLAGVVLRIGEWHALFWGAAGLAVAAGVLVFVVVPPTEHRPAERVRFDLAGAVTLAIALVCALTVITQGAAWGWSSPVVLALVAAAVIAGVGWAMVEKRSAAPVVQLSTLRIPEVAHAQIAVLLLGFTMFANYVAVMQLIQLPTSTGFGFGQDVLTAGIVLLPSMVMLIVGSTNVPRLAARFGVTRTFALGCAVSAVGYAGMILWRHELWNVVSWSALAQLGAGICVAAIPLLLIERVPRSQMSAALGFNNTLRFIGSATGSAFFASVATALSIASSGIPTEAVFTVVYSAALGVAVLLTLLNVVLSPSRRGETL